MVCWSNDFGLIKSGDSDIDFISTGFAHESQRAAARPAERADASGPRDFKRLALGKLKIVPPKRSPGHKRSTGALATIFAMTMSDVVGFGDALVANSTAQAAATNPLWVRFHR